MATSARFFRGYTMILLMGIMIIQILILRGMHDARPPALGEFREAKGAERRMLLLRQPMVHVSGSVDID